MRKHLTQMMKLILFVFCAIYSVQSKITTNKALIKAGDPFTLECDKPTATWTFNGELIAHCQNCPSSPCNVAQDYTKRITVFCTRNKSVLHFNSTQIGDKGSIKCPGSDSETFKLFVGSYNAHLRSENNSTFALNQKDYTLVCDIEQVGGIIWYNGQAEALSLFNNDCSNEYSNYDAKRFDITCDKKQKKAKFHIKHVTFSEDGKIIGCESAQRLYLFSLTVNVPVTSVSIQSQSQVLLEDEDGIFVCIVEESKPEASFQWIIVHQDGSSQEIQQKSTISKTLKGKLWQTTSTLTLNLKRDYQKIMCKATIENMPWTNSEYQLLDIKYSPQGKPSITVSQSGICAGKDIEILCEWAGGNPEATVILSCFSKVKEGRSSVKIRKLQTQKMDRTCTCNGKHIGKNAVTEKELNIHYPPNKVTISQTSYLEGQNASLICDASGGNPAVYTYSWSPGNYPHAKTINIHLTKASNKKAFTCKVYHECSEGKPVSSTRKLNVEYHPIIKMKDTITVIENETNVLNCPTEGNPKPTIKWKIGHNIFKSKLLKVSFTRNNETAVQCIATANSTKHGILESSKNISIFVTYSPEITIRHNVTRLQQKAQISCTAQASPDKIQYKMVQKWANTEKKTISTKQQNFRSFSFQDFGNWTCLASNDVPTKGYETKKSVEIKVNVSARFKGDNNETASIGSKKRLKTCFYCYPEATEVKWYKGNEEMSSDRITYVPAEDGLFPFTGNCSILELDITEKNIQIYYLYVTNPVGNRTFELTLDSGIPADSPIYIIISCVIAVFVIIIIIGGLVYVKFRRSMKKKQSNNNLVDKSNSANDTEMTNNSLYGNLSGVTNNAASNVEPLYAQVNKPKKLTKVNNANVEELYAKVDKSKKPQSQDKNASNVEPLYAQVNKPKKLTKVNNASDVEPLYAQVNKPKKLTKVNNANVEELYANVDKSKKPQSQDKNANVEELYAKVDKSKKPQPPPKVDKSKKPQPPPKNENSSVYANVKPLYPRKKVAEPKEEIYENLENLEIEQKKTEDKAAELMYADLEFFSDKAKDKQDPIKMKKEDQTMYASIDFYKTETGN